MVGGLEKFVRKINAKNVGPNRRLELIKLRSGEGEAIEETSSLEADLYGAIIRITPPNYPSYKRKKLEGSLRNIVGQYGAEILDELNSGDVNSKGEISNLTLQDLKRRE